MDLYERIRHSRQILGIPEKATLSEVEQKYKEALMLWHPDRCKEEKSLCEEKTREILAAGKFLLDYCHNYQIGFTPEAIKKDLVGEELWNLQFGKNDPLFGG